MAFSEAVAEAIALPLKNLHQHVGPYLLFKPGEDSSTETHQLFYSQHSQQSTLYTSLCRRVIAAIGEPCFAQRIPSYRFGLPNNRWVGSFHRDSDFGHSPFEINAICALTEMKRSSALHVETQSGSHQFEPMTLERGEVILFDHIDRLHGCPLNKEKQSVASIDFRFIPMRFATAAFSSAARSINTGSAFLPGQYFTAEPLSGVPG